MQVGNRLVDRFKVLMHNSFTLAAVSLLNRMLDLRESFFLRQNTADGEET